MAWLGGGLAIAATRVAARRSMGPDGLDHVMTSLRWADTWLGLVAPLIVVVTGVAMVVLSEAWDFGQGWVLGAIGLIVAYEAIALTVGARLYRRTEDAGRSQGPAADAHRARSMRALDRLSIVLLALLVAVVGLMVLKPGLWAASTLKIVSVVTAAESGPSTCPKPSTHRGSSGSTRATARPGIPCSAISSGMRAWYLAMTDAVGSTARTATGASRSGNA